MIATECCSYLLDNNVNTVYNLAKVFQLGFMMKRGECVCACVCFASSDQPYICVVLLCFIHLFINNNLSFNNVIIQFNHIIIYNNH